MIDNEFRNLTQLIDDTVCNMVREIYLKDISVMVILDFFGPSLLQLIERVPFL